MSLATTLMAVGLPGELATRIGYEDRVPLDGTGTTQGNATELLPTQNNVALGTGVGETAFRLPAEAEFFQLYFLLNTTAETALIFPPVGDTIDAALVDEPASIPVDLARVFMRVEEGRWVSISTGSDTVIGRQFVTPQMFGAKADGITDDTQAIQAAIDFVTARGGGEVYFSGEDGFLITDTIHAGSNIHLTGATQAGGLLQATSNTPILAFDRATDGQISRFSTQRLRLAYITQQTASETGAVGIYLGGADTTLSRFVIEETEVSGAYNGLLLPNIAGCTAFLGRVISSAFYQCADYGFSWLGHTSISSTNLELRNVWVSNLAGDEIAGSKGFQIARLQGLSMDNCGCDHVQGAPFFFTTVRGWIGTIWAESCDLTASAGSVKIFEASGSRLEIVYFYAVSNQITLTGTADCYLLYANTTSFVSVSILEDNINVLNDSSTGAYYTVNVDSTSYVENQSFRYTAAGASPVPNANLADFNTPKRIRLWDGWWRKSQPVTKTADFTVDQEECVVVDKAASTCTATLPSAATFPGRSLTIKTIQAQAVVSASSNVVPLTGGAAGTAILSANAGRWARLVSNGTAWATMEGVT